MNPADLLSIPLFIKYPGQTAGRIDGRNIESIDILPTIADVMGIDRTYAWAGGSALENEQRLRKSFRFEDGEVVTAATLPGVAESVKRQYQAFGEYPLGELPPAAMAFPELRGRDVSSITVPDCQADCLSFSDGVLDPGVADVRPMLLQGTVDRSSLPRGTGCLVAAVDGRVVESCRLIDRPYGQSEFHMMLSESVGERRGAVLEVFAAPSANVAEWIRLVRRTL
ncbi:MAG TPA: hypothetical protein VM510_17070 [Caulifigura sp.]|nr:hypothetical protein [Caulifigura sp.]